MEHWSANFRTTRSVLLCSFTFDPPQSDFLIGSCKGSSPTAGYHGVKINTNQIVYIKCTNETFYDEDNHKCFIWKVIYKGNIEEWYSV
jgi:hypothetical protein